MQIHSTGRYWRVVRVAGDAGTLSCSQNGDWVEPWLSAAREAGHAKRIWSAYHSQDDDEVRGRREFLHAVDALDAERDGIHPGRLERWRAFAEQELARTLFARGRLEDATVCERVRRALDRADLPHRDLGALTDDPAFVARSSAEDRGAAAAASVSARVGLDDDDDDDAPPSRAAPQPPML